MLMDAKKFIMKKILFALPLAFLASCNDSSDYNTTTTDSISKKDTIIDNPFDSGKTVSKSGQGFKDTTSYERQSTTTPADTSHK